MPRKYIEEDNITLDEMITALHYGKNTAAGKDGIKRIALKQLPEAALHYINDTFNLCFRYNYYPKK